MIKTRTIMVKTRAIEEPSSEARVMYGSFVPC